MKLSRCCTPQFRVLSDSQIEEIHLATLEVLRRTGVQVVAPEAVTVFERAGCWVEGDRVRIPAPPPGVALSDSRSGKPTMFLQDHRTYFGTGSDTPNVVDPYTHERRPA